MRPVELSQAVALKRLVLHAAKVPTWPSILTSTAPASAELGPLPALDGKEGERDANDPT